MSDTEVLTLGPGLAGRIREGDGDSVLWLHGYTLDSASWREMWDRLPGWRHVGMDLPGHGASDPIPPDLDLTILARRLMDVCDAQEVKHVVALSFGTLAATQLAMDFPHRFASVTLAAPTLAGGPQDGEVGEAYGELFAVYHTVGPGRQLGDQWMRCIAWEGIERLPELDRELRAIVHRHRWDELRSIGMLGFMRPPQPAEALQGIEAPVLILLGDRERPAFRQCADILEEALPRCTRVEMTDTHHLCMLESPDQAAPHLTEHLARHSVRLPTASRDGRAG